MRVDRLPARPVKQLLSSKTRHSVLPLPHLAHEILAIDFGRAVCLQFDVRSGTGRLLSVWGFFWLMVGPLDPVASKLGQQNEREGASAAQNLRAIDQNEVSVFSLSHGDGNILSCVGFLYLMDAGIRDVVLLGLQRGRYKMKFFLRYL